MSSRIFSRLGIAAVAILGLWAAGPAAHAQHDTPLKNAPNRFYPSGASISQKYEKPDANDVTLMEAAAAAAPGHVSSAAAMRNLMSQSKNRARVQKELAPVLRSQTRVPLTPGDGREALTAEAISSAPSLYKFTYGYHYKGVPVWKYSTQSQLIHVKNGARRTLLIRERNTPNVDRLGDNLTVTADEAGKATQAGLADSKDATDRRARRRRQERDSAPRDPRRRAREL